LLKAGVETVVS